MHGSFVNVMMVLDWWNVYYKQMVRQALVSERILCNIFESNTKALQWRKWGK